jgi:hypothetical protein
MMRVVCEGSSQLPGPAQRLTMTVKSQGAVGARKRGKLELHAGRHLPLGPAVLAITEAACCNRARVHTESNGHLNCECR